MTKPGNQNPSASDASRKVGVSAAHDAKRVDETNDRVDHLKRNVEKDACVETENVTEALNPNITDKLQSLYNDIINDPLPQGIEDMLNRLRQEEAKQKQKQDRKKQEPI